MVAAPRQPGSDRSPSMVIAPTARCSASGGVGGGVSALAERKRQRETTTTTAAGFSMRSFSVRSLTQVRRRSCVLVSDRTDGYQTAVKGGGKETVSKSVKAGPPPAPSAPPPPQRGRGLEIPFPPRAGKGPRG